MPHSKHKEKEENQHEACEEEIQALNEELESLRDELGAEMYISNEPTPREWWIEFDEKFTYEMTGYMTDEVISREFAEKVTPEKIKSFIADLLEKHDAELREKIETLKRKVEPLENLEGLEMNERNIKRLVQVSCDHRQNIVLSEILSLLPPHPNKHN